ncbi:hypothetical protein FRC0182_00632 [Corynebacterium diphtheriae]|nr:hypothetical protein FRC0182_00632 [Corynebacterium diphtheriae]
MSSTIEKKNLADARNRLDAATKNWEQAKSDVRRFRAEKLEAETDVERLEVLKREQDARAAELRATQEKYAVASQKLEELLSESEFKEFQKLLGESAEADETVGSEDDTNSVSPGADEEGSDDEDDTTVSPDAEQYIHDGANPSWQAGF